MPVAKWHDINRWIVKVPLTMAAASEDGPPGGLSATIAAEAVIEVTEQIDEPAAPGKVAPEDEPSVCADVVPKTKPGGKTKS